MNPNAARSTDRTIQLSRLANSCATDCDPVRNIEYTTNFGVVNNILMQLSCSFVAVLNFVPFAVVGQRLGSLTPVVGHSSPRVHGIHDGLEQ